MNYTIPSYKILPFDNNEPSFSIEFWQKSKDAYENKEYKTSIFYLLKYINKDAFKRVKFKKKDIKVTLEHGLFDFDLTLNNNFFKLESKVLKIDVEDKNSILALRKVIEANFNEYDIIQMNIKSNYLYIEYLEKLPLCNPEKLFEVINEFITITDRLVSLLHFEYSFELTKKLEDTLDIDDKKLIVDTMDKYINEYYIISDEFKDEQLENYKWDIGVITLMKISNLPHLNGLLKFKIYDAISYMYSDNSLDSKINRSAQMINDLKNIDRDYLITNIYKSKIFLSLYRAEIKEDIIEFFKSDDDIVQRYHRNKNNLGLFYFLYMKYIRLLYLYNINTKDKKRIEKELKSLSKYSLEKGANRLYKLYNSIINNLFFNKKDASYSSWYWIILLIVLILINLSKG